jgi:hypothetical protein
MPFDVSPVVFSDAAERRDTSCQAVPLGIGNDLDQNGPVASLAEPALHTHAPQVARLEDVEDEESSRPERAMDLREGAVQSGAAIRRMRGTTHTEIARRGRAIMAREMSIPKTS